MLAAAQADPLGAELARAAGVLGRVRVGAHAEGADSSAQPSTVSKASLISGSSSATSSAVTAPVLPSMAISVALAAARCSPTRIRLALRSIFRSPAPATQGLPIPRATSAAWLALPPLLVRMPLAAWKPATSSASVNGRTRITSRPSSAAATASSAR